MGTQVCALVKGQKPTFDGSGSGLELCRDMDSESEGGDGAEDVFSGEVGLAKLAEDAEAIALLLDPEHRFPLRTDKLPGRVRLNGLTRPIQKLIRNSPDLRKWFMKQAFVGRFVPGAHLIRALETLFQKGVCERKV